MYGITELKKGTVFEYEGYPYRVIEYAQKVMGRGGSIVNVKIKNLIDGKVLSKTFKGSDKLEAAQIDKKAVQYLYKDDQHVFFMDVNDYSQFEVEISIVQDFLAYLTEGAYVDLELFQGTVTGMEIPVKIPLKVDQTPDVVKGDTQSTVMKTAILETGAEIQVPIFIKSGDIIIVDTRTGSYVERQK
jgi:elongation factor P